MTLGLIGFSGTGKSSLIEIAFEQEYKVLDTDKLIEKETGLALEFIFKNFGENYFRQLEQSIIKTITLSDFDFIAFGGGINSSHLVWNEIRKQPVFICFLKENEEILFDRISKKRPLLKEMSKKDFSIFLKKRERFYSKDCDFIFELNKMSLYSVFEKLKVFI